MATERDIKIVISAQDLGTKKLEELKGALDEIAAKNEDIAKSGKVSSASMVELKQSLEDLKAIEAQLKGRVKLFDNIEKDEKAVADLSVKIAETKAKINGLKEAVAKAETGQGNLSKKLETQVKVLDRQELSYARLTESIKTAKAAQETLAGADFTTAQAAQAEALSRVRLEIGKNVTVQKQLELAQAKAADSAKEEARAEAAARQLAADARAAAADRQKQADREAAAAAAIAAEQRKQADREAAAAAAAAAEQRKQADREAAAAAAAAAEQRKQADREAAAAAAAAVEQRKQADREAAAAAAAAAEQRKQADREAAAAAAAAAEQQRQASEKAAQAAREEVEAAARAAEQQRVKRIELSRATSIQGRLVAIAERLGLVEKGAAAAFAKGATALRANSDATQKNTRVKSANIVATGKQIRSIRAAADAQTIFADSGKKALSVFQRIRGQLLSMVSAYVGLFGAISTGQRAFAASNERVALNTRLLVANGDNVEAAKADFAFLRAEADRLGFSLLDLGSVYSKLAIASKSAGLSVADNREIFSNFAEVARVNNLGVEETGRVFRAIEQIISGGKIKAEEVRNQLADVIAGAVPVLARSLKLNAKELDKALEQGTIGVDKLIGFSQEYAKSVRGQLIPATQSIVAELGRLSTAFDDFLVVLGEQGLNDAIRDISRELRTFLASEDGVKAAKDLADGIRSLGDAALILAENMDVVIAGVKIFIAIVAFQGLSKAAKFLGGLAKQGGFLISVFSGLARGALSFRNALIAVTFGLGGPVGIAIAVISVLALAWGALGDNASAADEQVTKLADDIEKAKAAFVESSGELTRADKTRAEAAAELEKAQRKLDGLLKKGTTGAATEDAIKAAKAERDRAAAILASADAQLAQNKADKAKAKIDIEKLRKQNDELLRGARARFEIAKATLEQAKAIETLRLADFHKARGRGIELAGGQLALASSNVDAAEASVAAIKAEIVELQAVLSRAVIPQEPPTVDEDKKGKKTPTADEITRIQEEAARAAIRIRQEALQQDLQLNQNNLISTLELIKIEFDAKIKASEDLAKRQRKLGLKAEAAATDAATAEIKRQQLVAEQIARTESANEARKSRQEAIDKARESRQKAALDIIEEKQKGIDRLISERDRKLREIEQQATIGRISEAQAAKDSFAVELQAQDAVTKKVEELRSIILAAQADGSLSLLDATDIQELLDKLDETAGKVTAINPETQKAIELNKEFAGGLADSFVALGNGIANAIRGVGSFKDAFKSAGKAFKAFLADFLTGIARAILQAIIFRTLIGGDGSSGIGGFFARVLGNAGAMHAGAVVGHSGGAPRAVNPAWFAEAPRFHSGGFPGLRRDEVPAILQTGEEVLSRSDSRNALNGGGSSRQPQKIEIVNKLDTDSIASSLGNSQQFKRTVHNVLRADKAAIRQILA